MAITAALVKELRERTGLGILDCKRALEAVAGDVELAIEELRKKSALKAAKKAGRTTADGILGVKVAPDGKRAAIVEVNIETDFAAKNKKFIAFVDAVLDAVYLAGNDNLEAVLASGLEAEREVLVQEIGENVSVRRAACLVSEDGYIASYLHGDDRKATLVELAQVAESLGRDVAMHVTATSPLVVEAAEVPADVLAKEREIYASQARDSGKPADIIEKMVEGRVRKYLAEVSLLDQPFVKDPKTTVGELIAAQGNQCRRFVRFEVGEGIDVEVADFAAEVAAQIRSSDDDAPN